MDIRAYIFTGKCYRYKPLSVVKEHSCGLCKTTTDIYYALYHRDNPFENDYFICETCIKSICLELDFSKTWFKDHKILNIGIDKKLALIDGCKSQVMFFVTPVEKEKITIQERKKRKKREKQREKYSEYGYE